MKRIVARIGLLALTTALAACTGGHTGSASFLPQVQTQDIGGGGPATVQPQDIGGGGPATRQPQDIGGGGPAV